MEKICLSGFCVFENDMFSVRKYPYILIDIINVYLRLIGMKKRTC